jgi:hypothetical protein
MAEDINCIDPGFIDITVIGADKDLNRNVERKALDWHTTKI